MKNLFITGVSTGIGYGATGEFCRNGYRVIGTVRKKDDADRLQSEFGPNFVPLILEVLAPEQAGTFLRGVLENPNPRVRYALVPGRFTNWTLPRILPHVWLDRLMAGKFRLTANSVWKT